MKRNGREYEYDYKLLILKGDIHNRLKNLSQEVKIPMGKLIDKLIVCVYRIFAQCIIPGYTFYSVICLFGIFRFRILS